MNASSPAAVLPFSEPDSHGKARAILGEQNFHGVMAAQQCFGPFTPEELERHVPLVLCDALGNPFTRSDEETLAVCEECKGTHILVACHSLSLVGIHAVCKDRMANDRSAPWFGEELEQSRWSSQPTKGSWLLIRKNVVPDSGSKSQADQQEHLTRAFPKERLTLPAEHVYAAIVHRKETGEKLCRGYWVRFPVQTAGGDWVRAFWVGERLYVGDLDDGAGGNVASGSARAAS